MVAVYRSRSHAVIAAAALAALSAAAGCTTSREREPVPTLAVEGYEYRVRDFVGRTVRVCGRLVRFGSDWAVEEIPPPGEVYFHGAPKVLIAGCGPDAPRLDESGCITGRIAGRSGEVTLPAEPRHVVTDDSPVDRDWFLHPLCPAAGR